MPGLKNKLEQKLSLKLSPQQIQLIKLLEIPVAELEQRIKKELEENPVLEEALPDDNENLNQDELDSLDSFDNEPSSESQLDSSDITSSDEQQDISYDDEFSPEDFMSDDDDVPFYKLSLPKDQSEEEKNLPYADYQSFHDYMLEQIALSDLEGDDRIIAEYIVGSLDDSGYLKRDINSIATELTVFHGIQVTPEHVEKVLKKIQSFDPPGIAARNLQECLSIQIDRKLKKHPDDKYLKLAKKVIENYFDLFTKKHYDKLKTKLNITEDELKQIINIIKKLNPKPANFYQPIPSKHNTYQIIPDFIVQNIDGKLFLTLNSYHIPALRINKYYKQLYDQTKNLKKDEKAKQTSKFLKSKIESANWFIDAIKQREETLMKTMKAIMDYQKDFFLTGDESKLKPMILKDIAERTNLDISTISRVANSKYVETPFGTYPLKFFFSEGLEREDGKEVSTREIKKILLDAIKNEDKKHPLTDEKLAQILQQKGYKIARRTVAKYREQMGIPVARLRKQL
jgi:RNA polymerase sigma-54 factor